MLDAFENFGAWEWFVQSIGFGGLVCAMLGFLFAKRKHLILLTQCLSGALWCVHFLLLGAYSGALLNAVAVIRSILFLLRDKYPAMQKNWGYAVVIFLVTGSAVFSAVMGDGWMAILPFCAMLITTYSLSRKSPFAVRLLTLGNSPFWIIYNFLNGSAVGIISEIINDASMLIGILRIDLPAKRRVNNP